MSYRRELITEAKLLELAEQFYESEDDYGGFSDDSLVDKDYESEGSDNEDDTDGEAVEEILDNKKESTIPGCSENVTNNERKVNQRKLKSLQNKVVWSEKYFILDDATKEFKEEDFLMSSVTDRPATAPALEVNNINVDDNLDPRDDDIQHENGKDNDGYGETTHPPISKLLPDTTILTMLTQDVKPFLKAMNWKNTSFGSKRGSSRILTEAPEKQEKEQEQKKKFKEKKLLLNNDVSQT
ncbi:hypothetical protein QE152_g8068 [Popillia japonica]|uniref:Uncharacterized protein n=1 Tax=Popillia japonica TaxID=7064 RepID=A0AAW1MD97_POPJA